jgi:peptidoglycan/LPS O-acetylase OafA/YrhL
VVISILIFLSILIRIWTNGSTIVYYNTLTAGEPLLLGCLICILEKKDKIKAVYVYFRILAALSLISLIAILFSNHDLHITNQPLLLIGYTNIDLIWTFLLIMLLTKTDKSSILIKIFSSRILVWLGIYSYGIYVFHWIILQLFIYKYEKWIILQGWSELSAYWLTRISGTGIILLISYLSFRLYEKKFLSLKKYFI